MKYTDNLFARRDARPLREPAALPASSPQPHAAPAQASPARPTAAPVGAEPAAARGEEAAGSKLIVGPNIKLKGVEIDACDTLVVEGRVEATMVSRTIQIAENGAFSGKVDVETAEIRGTFEGEMTARKRLVIHASGRVSGKIRYGKMQVQEGGEMSGDVGALGEAAAIPAR
jgi:cytoskeletal protein CcmA (bactofilin family)